MSGLEWIKIMSIFVLMFPVIGAQFLAATHFLRFDSHSENNYGAAHNMLLLLKWSQL